MTMQENTKREADDAMTASLDDIGKGVDAILAETLGTPATAERPAAEAIPLRSRLAAAPVTGTKVERTLPKELADFLATGERMSEAQRRRLLKLESEYHVGRAQLVDEWRVKIANVEHDGEEALRAFDRSFDANLAAARQMLAKLNSMRD